MHLQNVCAAKTKAEAQVELYESYNNNNNRPSYDCLYDGDDKVTVFKSDIVDHLTGFYLYQNLLLKLQEKLKIKDLKPGLHSDGVCSNIKYWEDALELTRNHNEHTSR